MQSTPHEDSPDYAAIAMATIIVVLMLIFMSVTVWLMIDTLHNATSGSSLPPLPWATATAPPTQSPPPPPRGKLAAVYRR